MLDGERQLPLDPVDVSLDCVAFLEEARTTVLAWMHDLQKKTQQVTDHKGFHQPDVHHVRARHFYSSKQ